MVEHRLKLHIDRRIGDDPGVVGTQKITVRERLLTRLLGSRRQLTIIVPGDSVRQIDITERDSDADLMALANAVGMTDRSAAA